MKKFLRKKGLFTILALVVVFLLSKIVGCEL